MFARTFLALDLDDSILDALERVRWRLDDPRSKVRWVARANLHVTLHFLGDVPDETIPLVCEAVAAAGQVEPFDVDVRGIECVPPAGPLRMVWANVSDPAGELAGLHEILAVELSGLGLREENRKFRGHVTLARVRSLGDPGSFRRAAGVYGQKDFGVQHVGDIVVYTSDLRPDGPVYSPVARAKLGGY